MKKVLFVCIGNSIRSQMAEAYARKYGSDVVRTESVGLSPAMIVDDSAIEVMKEVGISMEGHISKGTEFLFPGSVWDVVVNISGHPLPPELAGHPNVEWKVADPVGKPLEAFVVARDQIDQLVMRLVLECRGRGPSAVAPQQQAVAAREPQRSPTSAPARNGLPPWMNLFGGNPPAGEAASPATSQGQPLSRGMRRAIETGKLPERPADPKRQGK